MRGALVIDAPGEPGCFASLVCTERVGAARMRAPFDEREGHAMTEATDDGVEEARVERRAFLRRGGLVAGGAALGTAVAAGGAGAQVNAQAVDFTYFPVGPVRTYDSRNAEGPLSNGAERR